MSGAAPFATGVLDGRVRGDPGPSAPRSALPWPAAVALAGFVVAGNWKESPLLAGFPFDLTLVLAACTAAIVLWRVATVGIPFAAAVVLAGLALLAPPLLWTAASPYADEKSMRFYTLTALAALAPTVLVRGTEDARRLLAALAALQLLTVVNEIVSPQAVGTYQGAPLALPGVTTIAVGRSAGFVVLFAAFALIWKQRGAVLWAVPAGAAGIFVMLETGARSPLLSTAGALLITVVLLRRAPLRTVMTLGLAAAAVAGMFAYAPLYARERIESAAQGEVTGSIAVRVQLFEAARDSIGRSPLGVGWGGYERVAPTDYTYPHDLPLEVLAEAGILFGGLFIAWILLYYVWVRTAVGGFTGSVLFAAVTFGLLNATVSGDLNDNRVLFMLIGIAVAVVHGREVNAGAPRPVPFGWPGRDRRRGARTPPPATAPPSPSSTAAPPRPDNAA